MKKLDLTVAALTAILLMILTIHSACDDDCELKDCGDNGEYDSSACACDCYDNYDGEFCEDYVPEYSMTAQVSIDGGPAYSFDPEFLDVRVIDNTQDTIWIDGFSNFGTFDESDDMYLFFNIIVDDVYAVTVPATFSVSPGYAPGTAWASFLDPDADPGSYTPIDGSSGTITLEGLQVGGEISGTFDIVLFLGGSQAAIQGSFTGED